MKRWLAVATFLLALIYAGYAQVIDAPFTFDDEVVVKQNPLIKKLEYFLQTSDLRYRHLFYLTFALNYAQGEEDPSVYRLLNLGLHMGSSLLVLTLSYLTALWGIRETARRSFSISCLTAFAFALHPIQSEAVTYISGRSSSLMGFFYFLTILCYVLSGRKQLSIPIRLVGYLMTLFFSVLAILSKETAITLPAVLLLYDFCFMRTEHFSPIKHRLLAFYVPFPLLAVGMVITSSTIQNTVIEQLQKINPAYALEQVKVIAFSLRLLLFPINQSFDHEFPQANFSTDALRIATSIALLAGIIWILFRLRKNFPHITFGLGAYILILSPTNSVLPRMDLLSERNLYLPSWGIFFILACLWIHVSSRTEHFTKDILLKVSQGVFGLCLFVLLLFRNDVYQSNITLWEDVLAKAPGKARAYHNLSHFYLEEKNYDKAFVMLKKLAASNASPYYKSYAHTNLGNLNVKYGNMAQAEENFIAAARIYPEMPSGHFNLAILHATRKEFKKALAAFNRAEAAQKVYTEAHVLPGTFYLYRARVHFDLQDLENADNDLDTYLVTAPKNPDAWLLRGQIKERQGKIQNAINVYEGQVLKFGQPWHKAEAMRATGAIYKKGGQPEKAIQAYSKAVELNPDLMQAHYELGKLIWANRRDADAASRHLKRALDFHPSTTTTLEIENLLTKIESEG